MTCIPPNPETSGWHWIQGRNRAFIAEWDHYLEGWLIWGDKGEMSPAVADARGYHYLCECPSPAALAAMEQAQRETDDALAAARETIEELRGRITELTIMLDECEARGRVEL